MGLLKHAKTEMKAAGLYDKDADYGGMIPEAVEEIVAVFAKQGHSGCSAGIVISILEKVLRYQPLVPLTGKPDEWTEVSAMCAPDNRPLYQNKRCGNVFATDSNGINAWDIDGIIWVNKHGGYTNWRSRVKVKFPYIPKSKYVRVGWLRQTWWNIYDFPGGLIRDYKHRQWKKANPCAAVPIDQADCAGCEPPKEAK